MAASEKILKIWLWSRSGAATSRSSKKTLCCRYYLLGKIKLFFSAWNPTGKSVSHLIGFFWEPKMELSGEENSKGEKNWGKKLLIQLFSPLSFTMAAKKSTISVEFLLRGKKWCGKTRLTSHDLLVTNWKLESTGWDSNVWF